MNLQDYDELWAWTGEYVLGVLSAEENDEIERLMLVNDELRGAVEYWQDKLVGMTFLADPIDPVPDLWSRIEANLERVGQLGQNGSVSRTAEVDRGNAMSAGATNEAEGVRGDRFSSPRNLPARRFRPWHSIQFWQVTSVASLAAAVVLAIVLLQRPPTPEIPAFTAVLQSSKDQKVAWIVQGDAHHTLQVTPLTRTKVAANQALELWTIPDANQAPVSLGLVSCDRTLHIPAHRLPALQPGQTFAISLEPATGSPTGRPTGKILFAGTAVVTQ